MSRSRLPAEGLIITFSLAEGVPLRRPRGSDGYPPYDIERLPADKGQDGCESPLRWQALPKTNWM